jgi:hypothetical protein
MLPKMYKRTAPASVSSPMRTKMKLFSFTLKGLELPADVKSSLNSLV